MVAGTALEGTATVMTALLVCLLLVKVSGRAQGMPAAHTACICRDGALDSALTTDFLCIGASEALWAGQQHAARSELGLAAAGAARVIDAAREWPGRELREYHELNDAIIVETGTICCPPR